MSVCVHARERCQKGSGHEKGVRTANCQTDEGMSVIEIYQKEEGWKECFRRREDPGGVGGEELRDPCEKLQDPAHS